MRKLKHYIKNKKGVTIVESIVAIAIFAIISTMIYQSFSTAATNLTKANNIEQGTSEISREIATHADTYEGDPQEDQVKFNGALGGTIDVVVKTYTSEDGSVTYYYFETEAEEEGE